ncbi:MAG: IS1380 family transposase [bacterium]|nr:IS1380 family transposase [bacterium]
MSVPRFEIIQGDEHLTSHSGLALIGALLDRSGLRERCDAVVGAIPVREGFTLGDLSRVMTGLICLGKPDFDAVEVQRDQPFFAQSLGVSTCPSAPTLRQRLQDAQSSLDEAVRASSLAVIRRTAPAITGVRTPKHGDLVPVEMDVVVFDNSHTKKEGLGYTYQKCMGFAPIFSHVGTEGYLVNAELRTGNKHSQSETTPDFLRASLAAAKDLVGLDASGQPRPLALRVDAGFDSQVNITTCIAAGVRFVVARNRRLESSESWLETAQKHGRATEVRPGKIVWTGETTRSVAGASRRVVFEVIERTTKRIGKTDNFQELLMAEIEVETFWTDLSDSPEDVVEFYHGRGTSEQFHSEMKNDLCLERLPSNSFATNQLILLLGMLAYNLLRLTGQEALRDDAGTPPEAKPPLRKAVKRRRVRSVMDDLIRLAARIIRSGRRWRLAFGRHAPWAGTWARVYRSFMTPLPSH